MKDEAIIRFEIENIGILIFREMISSNAIDLDIDTFLDVADSIMEKVTDIFLNSGVSTEDVRIIADMIRRSFYSEFSAETGFSDRSGCHA